MLRLFLRQYLLMSVFLFASIYSINEGIEWVVKETYQNYTDRVFHGPFVMLEGEIFPSGKQTKHDVVVQELARVQKIMGEFKVSLNSMNEFTPEEQQTLSRGSILLREGDNNLYKMIAYQNMIMGLEQPEIPRLSLITAVSLITLFLIFAIIFQFVVIRPFARDLRKMRAAAAEFGEGHFATRVKLPTKSGLYSLAERFNEMAERIEFMIKNQNDLLNAVAHELRTPLARTRFALSMLDNSNAERQQQLKQSASEDLDEMETLLRELLGYGRLDARSGPPTLETIPIRVWLEELCEQCDWQIPVELRLDQAPTTLAANAGLLEHALLNVLRNAQRYAQKRVVLSCTQDAEQCVISIADDGPGIPPTETENVFQPFLRLDESRSRDTGGIGLGLAITRRIIERHSGRIFARSQHGELGGAEFVITLPNLQLSA